MELPINTIVNGDCLEVMKGWPSDCIDTIITDPPYGLSFMGKKWDYDVPRIEIWQECLRVLKPGGTLLCFAGSRTQHRMAVNVEDAGFILKDCIMYLYGSGFPKATDISKQLDKVAEVERKVIGPNPNNRPNCEGKQTRAMAAPITIQPLTAPTTTEAQLWNGWKSHGLKPAYEPILVAMKPNDGTYANNALKWGVSGLNIDGGRIPTNEEIGRDNTGIKGSILNPSDGWNKNSMVGLDTCGQKQGRFPANVILDEDFIPILSLTNINESGTMMAIKEFYHDYELPNVPKRVQSVSEPSQKRSQEVLQQGLLPQSPVKANGGEGASLVREKAQSGIHTEDETKQENQGGKRKSSIQGGLYVEGVSLHKPSGIESKRTSDGSPDDNKGIDTGTPACDGNETGQATKVVRAGTPPEWGKRRQQAGKSRSPNKLNSQDEPQADIKGTSTITKRERKIEVLDCDIPSQWLKYFEPTGFEIRDPDCAAAMLDEQSGELTSGAMKKPYKYTNNGYSLGQPAGETKQIHNSSSGGASRFFYCAKASKAERNAGCEGLDFVRSADRNKTDGVGGDNPRNRTNTLKRNHHPTVKPLALMEYLCRLTKTPTGGVVLDPFAGSGTTCIAALNVGRDYIGIERERAYIQIARCRIEQKRSELALFEGIGEEKLFKKPLK